MNAPSSPEPIHNFSIRNEALSGVVVFLVALPLCLGIALASNAPIFAGLIAGTIGGLIIAPISGSPLSVSGPAAGLAVVVATAVEELGSWEMFTAAVAISGVLQIVFGLLKSGRVGEFFPTSVIKGMLAAIGIIIILKQIPHALGNRGDYQQELGFLRYLSDDSLLGDIVENLAALSPPTFFISTASLFLLLIWDKLVKKKVAVVAIVPAALVAVLGGTLLNAFLLMFFPSFAIHPSPESFVQLPVAKSFREFQNFFTIPSFKYFFSVEVWQIAFTIALIGSIESLLCVEATDKLDPLKRISDTNRELLAQGVGNSVSGLLGGLPITSVIVRSSANVYSGAKTRWSAVFHGFWLLISIGFFPHWLNYIPLATLAVVLIVVGYRLATPTLFKNMFKRGWSQFLPFLTTVIAVITTDLLTGVLIGLGVGLYFVLKTNKHSSITVVSDESNYLIRFNKDMSFIHRAEVKEALLNIPRGSKVVLDGGNASYIDLDILETLMDFKESASMRGISVQFRHMTKPGIHGGIQNGII